MRRHAGQAGAKQSGRLGHRILVEAGGGIVEVRFGGLDAVLPPLRFAGVQRGGCPPRRMRKVEAAAAPGERVMCQDREAPPRHVRRQRVPVIVARAGRCGGGVGVGEFHEPVRPAELVSAVAVQGKDARQGSGASGRADQPAGSPGTESQLPAQLGGGDAVVRVLPVDLQVLRGGWNRHAKGVGKFLRRGAGRLVPRMLPDPVRPVLITGDRTGPDRLDGFVHGPAYCSGRCCPGGQAMFVGWGCRAMMLTPGSG
ncbi:hypothetical protein D9M72_333090 [compost metagenome]